MEQIAPGMLFKDAVASETAILPLASDPMHPVIDGHGWQHASCRSTNQDRGMFHKLLQKLLSFLGHRLADPLTRRLRQ